MILAIKKFFEDKLFLNTEVNQGENAHRIELASAALLLELMKIDGHFDERETHAIAEVLVSTFSLDQQTLEDIIKLAEIESHRSTSLFDFTSLINASYNYDQRVRLIENLWRVAYSDKRIDRYEDNLIRRISDLIYVNHSDFIKAKLKIRDVVSAS
ncbi:MAG: TerB family tellurite resistance protein [Gammaproteobacteria bacterium]|nr:TerB family tellurite resistance protein [Gammaproteobacteria bacterium]